MSIYDNEKVCLIFTGDMVGRIKIFDALTYYKMVEIAGHFRMVTSLDISKKLNRFTTTSEDTFLNVWKLLPEKGYTVSLLKSYNSSDKMLLGSSIMD